MTPTSAEFERLADNAPTMAVNHSSAVWIESACAALRQAAAMARTVVALRDWCETHKRTLGELHSVPLLNTLNAAIDTAMQKETGL